MSNHPYFPAFFNPITVSSDTNVIKTVTELFCHQFGNPTIIHRDYSFNPSPGITVNQTLRELKSMFLEDNTRIRTLSIWNNGPGGGGHTIIPYALERDSNDEWLYYLWVYDNSYPNNTTAVISIDTTEYLNHGRWDPTYGWNNWGGNRWFFLEALSNNYLYHASLPKESNSSVWYWPMAVEVDVTENSDIIVTNNEGKRTGFTNNTLLNEIPNGLPLMLTNGSEGPPYGYAFGISDYSIVLNNFQSDTIDAYFFSQNKLNRFQ